MAEVGDQATKVESTEEFGQDAAGLQKRWQSEIKLAQKEFKKWDERCTKIVDRYRDDREGMDLDVRRLQLLWANVQTELPAIYQRPPKAEVSRRFKAKDPVARTAAAIVERYLDVDLERDSVGRLMPKFVLDRLLCSRGQGWVEFDPVIGKVPGMNGQEHEQIVDVRAPIVYVHWKDFLHSAAPTWEANRWVARRLKLTRDECEKRYAKGMEAFGWTKDQIPLASDAKMDKDLEQEAGDLFKRADVWEIWDDESAQITFVVVGMQVPLEQKPQPFVLEGKRFPCPEPYYGTLTNETLVPVPEFTEWQDLADEIDELTERIAMLTRAVKVAGVRSKSEDALDRLLSEETENCLIPVDNWAAFAEKGGISGAIAWLPIDQIVAALEQLQQQRSNRIDLAYQMSGIGELLRAQGDANMTATQANIESNFGSLRLGQKKKGLAQFSEGLLRIKAQIICAMAPPDVLVMVSGIQDTDDAQFAGPAIQLLKDDRMRNFKIDVDEESMAAIDDQGEKQGAIEFLGAIGPYIQQVSQAAQQAPQMLDIAAESLGFVVRRMRAGRDFEGVADRFIESMAKIAEQARQQQQQNMQKPPEPPPEVQLQQMKTQDAAQLQATKHADKMQEVQASTQADMAREGAQAQSEMAIEQGRTAAKSQESAIEHAHDMELEAFKGRQAAELESFKASLQARVNASRPPPVAASPRPPRPH